MRTVLALLVLLLFPCAAFAQIGTQTVTDDFNRANETPLAGNWSFNQATSFNLSTNHVIDSGGNIDVSARYTPWSSGNDQYSQADITVVGTTAGDGPGVSVRMDTGGAVTFYRVVVDASGNYELARFVTGAFTSLRTGTLSYVATTKLGLSITGSTLKIWYNGVQVGTNVVDGSPIASGKPGIAYSSALTSYIIDNWDAGTTGVTTATSTRPQSKFFLFSP